MEDNDYKAKFNSVLSDPDTIDMTVIDQLIERYPYVQSVRFVQSKKQFFLNKDNSQDFSIPLLYAGTPNRLYSYLYAAVVPEGPSANEWNKKEGSAEQRENTGIPPNYYPGERPLDAVGDTADIALQTDEDKLLDNEETDISAPPAGMPSPYQTGNSEAVDTTPIEKNAEEDRKERDDDEEEYHDPQAESTSFPGLIETIVPDSHNEEGLSLQHQFPEPDITENDTSYVAHKNTAVPEDNISAIDPAFGPPETSNDHAAQEEPAGGDAQDDPTAGEEESHHGEEANDHPVQEEWAGQDEPTAQEEESQRGEEANDHPVQEEWAGQDEPTAQEEESQHGEESSSQESAVENRGQFKASPEIDDPAIHANQQESEEHGQRSDNELYGEDVQTAHEVETIEDETGAPAEPEESSEFAGETVVSEINNDDNPQDNQSFIGDTLANETGSNGISHTYGNEERQQDDLDVVPAEESHQEMVPLFQATPHEKVSVYHDDHLPYSFLWWLNKTRMDHAHTYQPYAAVPAVGKKVAASRAKGDIEKHVLEQQIREHIFHLQSPEDKLSQPDNAPSQISQKVNPAIERFIREEPQIKPPHPEKLDLENKAKKSAEDQLTLVSETLAKIYAEQGLYNKAIEVYKKLSLLYPEKSSYFADQIYRLENRLT